MPELSKVMEHYNLKSEASGSHTKFLCPFHSEKDASFTIFQNTPDWAYCFGCNMSYGAIDVIERMEGCDRSAAARIAKEKFGFDFGEKGATSTHKGPSPAQKLMVAANRYLKESNEVAGMWEAEKGYPLTETDINRFKLGWLPPDKIAEVAASAPGIDMKELNKLAGRVLFPVQTPSGDVVGFWARKTDQAAWKPEAKNIYIPLDGTRKKTPYLVSHFRWGKPLLVVEGAADAMVATADLKELSAIGAGGMVSNLTPDTFKSLGLDPPSHIIFVCDPDMAGEMDLIRHAPDVLSAWPEAYVLELPGQDIDVAMRVDGMKYADLKDRITPLAAWLEKQRVASPGMDVDLDDVVKSAAAEAAIQKTATDSAATADLVEILNTANDILDAEKREEYLASAAKARRTTVPGLVKMLKSVRCQAFAAKKAPTVFLHPAISMAKSVANIGFRVEDIFLGAKDVFHLYVVAKRGEDGTITVETFDDAAKTSIEADGNQYCVDKATCALPCLESAWSHKGLMAFASNPVPPDPGEVYQRLRTLFRRYVYLEYEDDYDVLTSYTIMTYFHRVFPAIPFLLLYGNKESGKTRTASLLQRLCFSAQMATRPSEAAMGDLLDGFRGTLIIDQAEFLSLKPFEPIVNFLAGTYTQDTGKRTIVQIGGKGGRAIREFDCFGPKIFGATRDPHADLRDRLVVVPFFRPDDTKVLDTLKTPTSTSENWGEWRGMLYSLYLTKFRDMMDASEIVSLDNGNSQGRSGELLRPLIAIMKFCNIDEATIDRVVGRASERMREIRPTITRLDEQILITLYDIVKIGVNPQEIMEVPLSLLKEKCAESEEISGVNYESVLFEVLKRNGAFLKSQRRFGEIMLLTNIRTVLRSLSKLGCVPEDVQQEFSMGQQQISIPLGQSPLRATSTNRPPTSRTLQ